MVRQTDPAVTSEDLGAVGLPEVPAQHHRETSARDLGPRLVVIGEVLGIAGSQR